MKSTDIRKSFLYYFTGKGHSVVASSGLLPKDDPTLLFTNAGMVQFKRVFLGEEKRPYSRAVSSQKCIRAGGKHNDLENVGHTARHHTFFEMLGNFSFGDYFKEDAIKYAWEYLTEVLKLPKDKLWATVFEEDDEAEELWQTKTDISHDRIKRLGAEDNFWSMGDVGPCGPCSEILIDQGEELGCDRPDCAVGCDCDRYLEIWNLVFMQFSKDQGGNITDLPRPSIDTGMGLERLAAILQGKHNNYDTDLFAPIIKKIEKLSGATYNKDNDTDSSIRAIADHARSVTFLISEGLLPSNEGRGYVLRRIIRRAARHGKLIGINKPFLFKVTQVVADHMSSVFPELTQAKELIEKATFSEEEQFFKTLERGLGMLEEEVKRLKDKKATVISGGFAFKLYDTFGFPLDLTADIIKAQGMSVDEAGFNERMAAQKDKARLSWKGGAIGASGTEKYTEVALINSEFIGYTNETALSEITYIYNYGGDFVLQSVSKDDTMQDTIEVITKKTPFYGESGGQAGDRGTITGSGVKLEVLDTIRPFPDLIVHHCKVTEGTLKKGDKVELAIDKDARDATRRNHTATHLLHAALRRALGEHVRQAGSLVNKDSLRFDFNHFNQLTPEEITKIEDDVNKAIRKNIAVTTETLPYKEAVKRGALAFFGDKYGNEVRMVQIPEVSTELCGGTHVKMTGDIGLVKVTSESSVAAGVRRLEAVTGEAALKLLTDAFHTLADAATLLKTTKNDVPNKIHRMQLHQKELEKEIARTKEHGKSESANKLAGDVQEVAGIKVLAIKVGPEDGKDLRKMADLLRDKLKSGIVVLGCASNGKAVLLAAVTKDLTSRFSAGDIIKAIAPIVGGRGGGKADMAQAGGKDGAKIDAALKEVLNIIKEVAGDECSKSTEHSLNKSTDTKFDIRTALEIELLENDMQAFHSFKKYFDQDISVFINNTVETYNKWEAWDSKIGDDLQKAHISAFIYNSITTLVTSTKLLINGHIVPSGNLMRQTLESYAMAILCSNEKLPFLEQIKKDTFKVSTAINTVEQHAKNLNVNTTSFSILKKHWKFYHNFSHATFLTIASNISFSNTKELYFGAQFDKSKIKEYTQEINGRLNLSTFPINILQIVDINLTKK